MASVAVGYGRLVFKELVGDSCVRREVEPSTDTWPELSMRRPPKRFRSTRPQERGEAEADQTARSYAVRFVVTGVLTHLQLVDEPRTCPNLLFNSFCQWVTVENCIGQLRKDVCQNVACRSRKEREQWLTIS